MLSPSSALRRASTTGRHLPRVDALADLHGRGVDLRASQLVMVTGRPKAGKAQPLDTPTLAPSGWVKMGDLAVGDMVIGSNGKAVQVEAVYDRGILDAYRVTLDDGTSTLACGEHLWTVTPHTGNPRPQTLSTLALRGKIAVNNRFAMLPVVEPVEFTAGEPLPMDPYLLGLLLGDGGFRANTPTFSSADPELVESVRAALPAGISVKPSSGYDYRLSGPDDNTSNPLTVALRGLGLWGLKSDHKFIPEAYLRAPKEDRAALLAGLMDTDGGMERNSVTYSSTSALLVEGVRELVLSLGGCVRSTARQTHYRNAAGDRVPGLPSWRLVMRLPGGSPFRLARKSERFEGHAENFRPPTRRIVSIEPEGSTAMRCIKVADEGGLYVTENYIVTHNTFLAQWWVSEMQAKAKRDGEECPVLYFFLDGTPFTAAVRQAAWATGDKTSDITEALEGPGAAYYEEALSDLADTISYAFDKKPELPDIAAEIDAYVELWDRYPSVMVFDNLLNFAGCEEDHHRQKEVLGELQAEAYRTGACIIVLHHASESGVKDYSRPPRVGDTDGKVNQLPEMVLTVAKDPNSDRFQIAVGAIRDGGASDPQAEHPITLWTDLSRVSFTNVKPIPTPQWGWNDNEDD